jgi:NAD(P)-dependent dehydrogenase (short-subunit alcohol dehydrogenase family)
MRQALKPLAEQTIVITGASRGIGRETALRAAKRGARVVVAARDSEALDELVAAIETEGGVALAVPTDVSNFDEVRRLAERAAGRFGGIDTWVNNAAVSLYGRFEDVPIEDFKRVVEVNFFGQVYGCRAALPYLKEYGGALICVGSALSDRAIPLQSAYCASKHGIKAVVESLRVELAVSGDDELVQVTLIKPASIDTPLFDNARTFLGYRPKPVFPVYTPGVCADAILHCAEHREREIAVGGGAALLTTLESFAGPVLDRYFAMQPKAQQTKDPKSADAPNNLRDPLPDTRTARGQHAARPFSVYTWLRTRPRVAVALAGTAAGAALLRSSRATNGRGRGDGGHDGHAT